VNLLFSIPSPGSNAIHIGPLQLRAYGLMIALGVVAAVWLAGRRLERSGQGTRDDFSAIAVWAVLAGVLGARAYHVVTSWNDDFTNPVNWFKIWEGGLGIPGGLAAGIMVGVWRIRQRGVPVAAAVTAAAPALPLAQAIGRVGNWFNQEVFGRPTDLPWALEISDGKAAAAGYPPGTTFHPTFLYESLGNLVLVGLLLLVERKVRLRPGALMAVYLAGYALLRFGVESLRIDAANEILGLRVNTWVSAIVFVAAAGYLAIRGRPPRPTPPESDPASSTPHSPEPAPGS
jgi:prolipoprotein diacylglyceryl transferase